MSIKPEGYVYIIQNSRMRGVLKIGFTTKSPVLRATDIHGFGGVAMPGKTVVIFELFVPDARAVEKEVHSRLSSYRQKGSAGGRRVRTEWFSCSIDIARECILEATRALAGPRGGLGQYATGMDAVRRAQAMHDEMKRERPGVPRPVTSQTDVVTRALAMRRELDAEMRAKKRR
ncbi:GIY-YIG nuclease family protein [Roseomonas sp. CAU 1739]|uniref:GIY-YIG nuclease family protein n=1 Tax=Roseomonas sp. CAU 1739 TaxID=3140364 RepID=UPI00325AF0F8